MDPSIWKFLLGVLEINPIENKQYFFMVDFSRVIIQHGYHLNIVEFDNWNYLVKKSTIFINHVTSEVNHMQ